MKIAYISYEYPPDTALGGIATYVRQAANLMVDRGHTVEVFAASDRRNGCLADGKITLNLSCEMNRSKFPEAVAQMFEKRHSQIQFDVVEGPEFGAEGGVIRSKHPEVAHLVKLHTPSQLICETNAAQPELRGWWQYNYAQARIIFGAFRRGLRPPRYHPFRPHKCETAKVWILEQEYATKADLLVSPSKSLRDWAIQNWRADPQRALCIPNPYTPSPDLLNVVAKTVSNTQKIIGFFGRLEQRKGVSDLVEAIPLILEAEPTTRFRFVGRAMVYPGSQERFDAFIKRKNKRYTDALEFTDSVALDEMPRQYAAVDICVFPSIWENFPNVCLEAMAAARPIVASKAGGMAEMLEDGKHGILVPPRDFKAIAKAVIKLIRSPELCQQFGEQARRRVITAYNADQIGSQLEHSLNLTINLRNGKRTNGHHLQP